MSLAVQMLWLGWMLMSTRLREYIDGAPLSSLITSPLAIASKSAGRARKEGPTCVRECEMDGASEVKTSQRTSYDVIRVISLGDYRDIYIQGALLYFALISVPNRSFLWESLGR